MQTERVGLARAGSEEKGNEKGLLMCPRFLFGVVKMFWNQMAVMVIHLCEYTKAH